MIFTYFVFLETQRVLSVGPTSWMQDQKADCAVVLTGGGARISEGFSLLSQQRVKKLIISGVHPQAALHEIFPQLPFYGNVNEKDILLEKHSLTTYGNVQQSVPILEALNCKSMVLITSRLHMHRAMSTFQGKLSSDYEILPRAVVAGSLDESWQDLSLEVLKSLFYSIWAY